MKPNSLRGAIAVLLLLTSVSFISCKKYVDGPKISLRSKVARLASTWTVSKYLVNDVDSTSQFNAAYSNYTMVITKDKKYTITYTNTSLNLNYSESGTWDLGEDKDDIRFLPTGSSYERSYRILRLKNKELWWRQTLSTGAIEKMYFEGNGK